jgi:hypothetical protein
MARAAEFDAAGTVRLIRARHGRKRSWPAASWAARALGCHVLFANDRRVQTCQVERATHVEGWVSSFGRAPSRVHRQTMMLYILKYGALETLETGATHVSDQAIGNTV